MGRGRNTFTGNESTLTVHAMCTMIQTVIGWSSPKSELCWSGQTITLTACFHSFFLLLKNIMHFNDTSIICKKIKIKNKYTTHSSPHSGQQPRATFRTDHVTNRLSPKTSQSVYGYMHTQHFCACLERSLLTASQTATLPMGD